MNPLPGTVPAAAPKGQPSSKETRMNKDQVKGRIKEATSKVKEVTGKVVGNESLEAEGKVDQVVGEVQADYGDLKEDIKDAVKKPA
ncbi:csbd family protein [Thauera aminoaromatica S2]|uniref:Csbd family protein n=2 Tax=Thauera aminoaromatica TaxID=164330 RepID=N6Z0U5_THASP|nr:csbd family protein [Thauera aminoaromatica S2]